jgi:hypothetical protein
MTSDGTDKDSDKPVTSQFHKYPRLAWKHDSSNQLSSLNRAPFDPSLGLFLCLSIIISKFADLEKDLKKEDPPERVLRSRKHGTNLSFSLMNRRRSYEHRAGNNGKPRKSSAATHPSDHISMAVVYLY